MTNKYTSHVPTEQYGYLSVETEGTAQDAVDAYKELQEAWKGGTGEGLPLKEWCTLRNKYLETGVMEGDPGDLKKLSKAQAWWVNETKKALSAIKSKN